MRRTILISMILFYVVCNPVYSQDISFAGQFGWAQPKGDSFVDSNGEDMASGGLNFDGDILYHPDIMNNKIGFGVTYNGAVLFGASTSGTLEIGMYGLALYGIKGYYRFFISKVSPYVSLSTGLAQFSTPEITSGGEVIAESDEAYSFGLRPELGVELGGFILSAAYIIPMKYKITDETAGALEFSLGYRYKFSM